MNDIEGAIEGEPIDTGVFFVSEPPKRKGFLNPETLALAQETRRKNREEKLEGEFNDGAEPIEPRKRGRPKGIPNRKSRDLQAVEAMFVSIHAILATSAKMPEAAIGPDESHMIIEAFANVMDQYKIKLDGKTGAAAVLIYSLGLVYGPRAVAVVIRKRNESRQPK